MASNDFIKDISKFELRDIIDAISHQVEHLEKSQVELLAALEEDPTDKDFSEAYNENIVTLEKKEQTIVEFKTYLKEIDFAYYLEHYRNALLADATPPTQPASVASEDAGVYL